jgi:hypothetical protein
VTMNPGKDSAILIPNILQSSYQYSIILLSNMLQSSRPILPSCCPKFCSPLVHYNMYYPAVHYSAILISIFCHPLTYNILLSSCLIYCLSAVQYSAIFLSNIQQSCHPTCKVIFFHLILDVPAAELLELAASKTSSQQCTTETEKNENNHVIKYKQKSVCKTESLAVFLRLFTHSMLLKSKLELKTIKIM